MTKKQNRGRKKFFSPFFFFFSLSCTKPFWGCWIMIHSLYDSPLPIHIPWNRLREAKRKKFTQNPKGLFQLTFDYTVISLFSFPFWFPFLLNQRFRSWYTYTFITYQRLDRLGSHPRTHHTYTHTHTIFSLGHSIRAGILSNHSLYTLVWE